MNRTNYHYIYGAAFGRGCLVKITFLNKTFFSRLIPFGVRERKRHCEHSPERCLNVLGKNVYIRLCHGIFSVRYPCWRTVKQTFEKWFPQGRQPDVPGGFNGERLAFGFKNRSQTFICCRGVASRSSLLPAEKQPLLFSGMIARPREESQVGKIKDLIQVNRSAD
ncbi:hypothetical protein PCASD_06478 [Puccinia coronata f. sp. avenae]|uniref:Uncharacterized protein n=1 Tax=Puccinia coronata f. sp. avenae TaxID=200324 RepID=A0A2N5V1Q6_9BASI|nr:hypothetical protein PCASD_06478 [Puccinia coronata f. sp. avenae]